MRISNKSRMLRLEFIYIKRIFAKGSKKICKEITLERLFSVCVTKTKKLIMHFMVDCAFSEAGLRIYVDIRSESSVLRTAVRIKFLLEN